MKGTRTFLETSTIIALGTSIAGTTGATEAFCAAAFATFPLDLADCNSSGPRGMVSHYATHPMPRKQWVKKELGYIVC